MTGDTIVSQPVLILGGGRGGLAFLELFSDESLFHVIGVVDTNDNAPAIKMAKGKGIQTFDDTALALQACMPCTIFNLTHDDSIEDLVAEYGKAGGIIGGLEARLIWEMVTRLKKVREQLEKSNLLNDAVINHAREGIILIGWDGIVRAFNPAAVGMFGYAKEEVVEKNISMLMPEPDRTRHDSYLNRYADTKERHVVGVSREVVAARKDGTTFPMSLSVNEMIAGEEQLFVGIVSDITERKENEERIKHLAHFDMVTDLPNRVLFFDRLKSALAHARRNKQQLGVFFLDLDGFKQVNDSFGHNVGDELLQGVASRLLEVTREADTISRFGGDEFAFVINHIDGKESCETVATKVIESLAAPFFIDQHKCEIGASIGISIFPKDSQDFDTLIKQADTAMYKVKHSGKNGFCFYDSGMEI